MSRKQKLLKSHLVLIVALANYSQIRNQFEDKELTSSIKENLCNFVLSGIAMDDKVSVGSIKQEYHQHRLFDHTSVVTPLINKVVITGADACEESVTDDPVSGIMT